MKTTALTNIHTSLGAKMAEFAGYNMPISYAGIKEEHHAVRNGVGMFDVSHMGEFIISGPKAFDLVQFVTSNNVSKLKIGDAQYSCFPNKEGGIVDDLIVYKLEDEKYLLVVNASNIEKDWNWIEENNKDIGADMKNISDDIALLAVQGPKADETLQKLTEVNLSEVGFYTFKIGDFAGERDVIISATGYTGSGGFELYIPKDSAETIWNQVMKAGEEYGIQPCGLGARDTLRLEMGYCLYGNDINDTTSPIEAGLGWITKVKKGDFNSQAIFQAQKTDGVTKKLVGFTMDGKRVPRHGYQIEDMEGNVIGEVTSGTMSPSLGYPIGMGYVAKGYSSADTDVNIVMRNKKFPAKVVKLPFLKIEK